MASTAPAAKHTGAVRRRQGATSLPADDRELDRGPGRLVDLDPELALTTLAMSTRTVIGVPAGRHATS